MSASAVHSRPGLFYARIDQLSWSPEQANAWVSPARLEPFLTLTRGDHEAAHDLYVWHGRLSGACLTHVQHFEVLLRTTIDQAIGGHAARRDWLFDADTLTPDGRAAVKLAQHHLDKTVNGDSQSHSDVVAALPLGFWRAMFRPPYERLWRAALRTGFPYRPPGVERRLLGGRVEPIRKFRNRLAHHEPILSVNFAARLREMELVCEAIDPAAAAWIQAHSTVRATLAERPLAGAAGA